MIPTASNGWKRGYADTGKSFRDAQPGDLTVWETYKEKREVFLADPATGPDTYVGFLVSTFQGSTETTFYVLAVYFGAVQIRRIRHALAAGLTADIAGIAAAVFICAVLFA